MDEWVDGWIDVCMYVCIYIYVYMYTHIIRWADGSVSARQAQEDPTGPGPSARFCSNSYWFKMNHHSLACLVLSTHGITHTNHDHNTTHNNN